MEKKYFSKVKERVVKDVTPFDRIEFLSAFLKNRPTEIWCDEWSSKAPLYVITEYKENSIMCYCNSAADKTPTEQDQDYIYYQLKYAGLAQSYFVTPQPLTYETRRNKNKSI